MASGRIEAKDIFDVDGIISAASDISNALAGINNLIKGEAGKLKIEIGSTADMQRLSEIAKSIEALADVHKRAADFADAHATAVTNLATTLNGATKPAAGANQALRQLGLSLQQLDKIANTTNRQSIVSLAQNLQTLTKDIKANEAAIVSEMEKIDASKMTYNELSATLSVLKEAVKGVSTAELEESAAGQKMTSVAKSLNDQLAATDAKMGGHKRNVGNYASAFDGLGFSIRQVVRETPSLGIGFNQYFLAISNNIPMLIDEWKRYGQTMRETNKKIEEGIIQGQKMEGTWKHALRSVVSWQTAVIAVLTILSNSKLMETIGGWFKDILGIADKVLLRVRTIGEELSRVQKKVSDETKRNVVELNLLIKLYKESVENGDAIAQKGAIARINELTKATLEYGASIKTVTDAVNDYLVKDRQRKQNEAVIDQLTESAKNRATRASIYNASSASQVVGFLGATDNKEIREIEKEWEKFNKLREEYRKARNEAIAEESRLRARGVDVTRLTVYTRELDRLNKEANRLENTLLSSKFMQRLDDSLPVSETDARYALEVYYDPMKQQEEKGRAKRQKEEKASYEDLWHKMMEDRYKIVSDEYQREARQRADAYQLEVYDTRKLYKDKENDLKEYFRVQLGLSKDDKTWETQIENNEEYHKKLVELRYQLDSILKSNEQEFYRDMDAMNKEYTESVISGYKTELDAFNAAEDAKVKSARKHITRRNKTLSDNYNRNNSIMTAAAASQAKIDALEAKRLDAIVEKGKKQHNIYLQQQDALKAIEEEEKEVQKEYDKLAASYNKQISKAADAMREYNGNVDLLHRKLIDTYELTKKGWDTGVDHEGIDYSTLFTSSYGKGRNKLLITPILPNGEVLSEDELNDYVDELMRSENPIDADRLGLVIHFGDISDDGKKLHEMQEEYYGLIGDMEHELQTSAEWFRLSAIREQKIAMIGQFDNLRKQMDEAFNGINEDIKKNIETEKDNLVSIISELDLTKEFEKKGLDRQIVESLFGLNNAGGQERYILEYYERLARKVADATGRDLVSVMEAYATQLNAKYGTNISVSDGHLQGGANDRDAFSGMWGDIFSDRFWDEFSEYKDALSDMASTTWDYVDEMIDAWVELANAKAEAAAEVTENAKTEYEKEKSLMDAGYANQMETAWKVYNEKKEIQEQAEREAKEAAALQQKLDTATQISSLITAAAKIFESMSSAGVIGVALAAAGVAAMIASFISSKSMARQAAQYGEGHVEYIGYGGSHASGNDNPLAVDAQGRERKIERGEVFSVIKGRSVRKYGLGNVMSLLSAVNDGTYQMGEDANRRNYAIGILPARGNNFPSLATIEGSLASIDNKVGRTSYIEADGTRTTIDGNNVVRTRRIV